MWELPQPTSFCRCRISLLASSMALAILGIGLGQAGIAGQAGAGGQPGGLAAAAKPSANPFEYIVVTVMYRAMAHKRRTYFIYTLFESVILE